jgi:hypothetical protein
MFYSGVTTFLEVSQDRPLQSRKFFRAAGKEPSDGPDGPDGDFQTIRSLFSGKELF